MSNSDAPQWKAWDSSRYETIKDEIIELRYYKKREADSVGRRIARGGDPRATGERITMSSVDRRYEELERSELGKKLIAEVIAEEEAIEASNEKLLRGSCSIMEAGDSNKEKSA
ncbi:hypothetical protein M407DRAFT_6344 [Tulasnella calospora MUT 4182]|uniref:Uncharacterized protein n=1 Tax=Tulasnella calospora MUT 4182 TaxID=1051891 RepID=A0A0C3L602_9AGAM|nr:hypothetical protein M407DRAFT_6344 [Tulasnella calospora MUT 4182]